MYVCVRVCLRLLAILCASVWRHAEIWPECRSSMATTDIIPPMSKALAVKAKRELREDPKTISAHMTSIRRWATSVPHIEFHFGKLLPSKTTPARFV
ncbi:unnamed protein product [Protopolystoma xenopodis]|uniref:Secreted protein n=1 Tax=Protopolystoma xenopodis TaxID=117903 RepID=A0A448WIS2_9PLAT|nr:unnamed protein product [Protopolystoma xenopodis]